MSQSSVINVWSAMLYYVVYNGNRKKEAIMMSMASYPLAIISGDEQLLMEAIS